MKLEGTFTVNTSRIEAYRFLIDPNRLAKYMPDIQGVEVEDEDNFTLKASVGVSHIRGTMTMKMKLVEKNEPVSAKLVGKGAGMASAVDMITSFTLEEAGDRMTSIHWVGDAKIGGKLAALGGGLMERLAKKNVEKFVSGIQEGLGKL